MKVPALAARAPLGATNDATGTGEARIALMISRIDVSRPPGVSMRSTTSSAPSFAARSIARLAKSALAGPMAPSSGTTCTGAPTAQADQRMPTSQARTRAMAPIYRAPVRAVAIMRRGVKRRLRLARAGLVLERHRRSFPLLLHGWIADGNASCRRFRSFFQGRLDAPSETTGGQAAPAARLGQARARPAAPARFPKPGAQAPARHFAWRLKSRLSLATLGCPLINRGGGLQCNR